MWLIEDYGEVTQVNGHPQCAEAFRTRVVKEMSSEVDTAQPKATAPFERRSLLGVHSQPQPGKSRVGVHVPVGRMSVLEARQIADLADKYSAGEVRLTVEQNVILPNVDDDKLQVPPPPPGPADPLQPIAAAPLTQPCNPLCSAGAAGRAQPQRRLPPVCRTRQHRREPRELHRRAVPRPGQEVPRPIRSAPAHSRPWRPATAPEACPLAQRPPPLFGPRGEPPTAWMSIRGWSVACASLPAQSRRRERLSSRPCQVLWPRDDRDQGPG